MFPNIDFVRFRPLVPDDAAATAAAASDEIAALYQRHPELEMGELEAPAARALGPARHMVRLLVERAAATATPHDYDTALKVLQLVGAQTHFAQQPATAAAFADNEYLLFLFYKLAVYLQLVWFDGEYSDAAPSSLAATAPPDVNPELIYKKARVYFEKLRRVLAADGADTAATECHYYHLICWLRLTEVFRGGHYPQYYAGFVDLLELPAVALAAPADVLWQCGALRTDAVYMFGVALALTLAFRDMAFLTAALAEQTRNAVIDLCGELLMYRHLTLLLQTEFAAARQLATSADFQAEFDTHLGRLDRGGLHPFFVQTVTLKAFLLVMLHTRRILGEHLMALLAVPSVQPLLEAISLLDLGQSGVGYSVEGAYFYNEGAGAASARQLARREIEQVRHRLEGDSVAECVRGALIERLLL